MSTPTTTLLLDHALKTLGALLIAASLGLSTWALKSINEHEARLVRVETRNEEIYRVLASMAADIREIKSDLKHVKTSQ